MDQGKTAGIGNYILSESLYLARVFPWARCGQLDDATWHDLHAAASDVIARSHAAQARLARSVAAHASRPRCTQTLAHPHASWHARSRPCSY